MFAPKHGHVTRCVTRDGLTFVSFLSGCVALRCCRLLRINRLKRFTVLSS